MSTKLLPNVKQRDGKFKVYCMINKINKKKYTGITTYTLPHRFSSHLSAADPHKGGISGAIAKYGKDNWMIYLIDDTAKNWDELCNQEKYYIKSLRTKAPNGYNLTDGGEGQLGVHLTVEQRKQRSIQFKQYYIDHPEAIEIQRQKMKQKHKDDPTIAENFGKWSAENNKFIRAVEINGKKYSKIKEAAIDIGTSDDTIRKRIIRGVKGYKYANESFKGNNPLKITLKNEDHPQAKRIEVNGKTYSCIKDAANQLNMKYQNLYYKLKSEFHPSYKYIDNQKKYQVNPDKQCGANNPNARAITINDQHFNSIVEASKITNISTSKISDRLKSKNFPEYKRANSTYTKEYSKKTIINKNDKSKHYGANHPNAVEITIEDKLYHSIEDAARFLETSRYVISFRLKSKNYPEYQYAKNVDNVELLQIAVNQ